MEPTNRENDVRKVARTTHRDRAKPIWATNRVVPGRARVCPGDHGAASHATAYHRFVLEPY